MMEFSLFFSFLCKNGTLKFKTKADALHYLENTQVLWKNMFKRTCSTQSEERTENCWVRDFSLANIYDSYSYSQRKKV